MNTCKLCRLPVPEKYAKSNKKPSYSADAKTCRECGLIIHPRSYEIGRTGRPDRPPLESILAERSSKRAYSEGDDA